MSSIRRGGRIPISDVEVARSGSRVLCQTRTSRPLSDADLAFQLKREPSSSAFQHRREPVSSASQHQSKVRVQRETRISAVTDSHELDQLHPIFSPHNGE